MWIPITATLLLLYAVVLLVGYLAQGALIYPAPAQALTPAMADASLERFPVPGAGSGFALYARAPAGQPTIVHFHGNGEDLARVASLVERLHASGLGAYAIEYPGYGLARPGTPSEAAIFATAEAALAHLVTALGVSRESVVLEGQSLGTGVAAEMALRGHGARLILISPYTSMTDMAALAAPFLPTRWLLRDRYDTERIAPQLRVPTLVIHGTDDEVIPVRMGERVAKLVPGAVFWAVAGGHHNDLFELAGAAMLVRIAAFARAAR